MSLKRYKLKELDTVTNKVAYLKEFIPANSEGVIVFAYPSETYFEVEFFVNGTSAVRTCHINNLILKKSYEEPKPNS